MCKNKYFVIFCKILCNGLVDYQSSTFSSLAAKTLLKTDSGQFGEDSDKL